MTFAGHLQTNAAPRSPRRTPRNGLEIANQKEKFRLKSWAIEFVSTMLSKEFQVRHFTKSVKFLRNRMLMQTEVTQKASWSSSKAELYFELDTGRRAVAASDRALQILQRRYLYLTR